MSKQDFHTAAAPAAIGPYSQAVGTSSLLYTSGQLGMDPSTMELVSGGVQAQTEQALKNLSHVLEAGGCAMKDVIKTTIFVTNMGDFAQVNEVYSRHFTSPFPARSCVQVAALPKGAVVEIEGIAVRQ
eukprot:Protomagalhaensia_sp_Gyna_25__5327@NODE_670_length_2867_cov_769_537836_g524_i0_p3_GENE_NODE_670_length_2867_cov_769_537836_g524_i0NODE_670_length_2867_cov_769_537836_g524_i0_p3_ORF_typecomplete_len128_score28_93Ribonuc_LPSP/PF01042_21/2_2e45YjgF_endoribonc/PF14588_6/3_1e06_NODE_670_length_2867_cov_769_537836_g524_i023222705